MSLPPATRGLATRARDDAARARRAQVAFLVGVENRDQRHLGEIEPFAQQIDADEDVEHAAPEIADDVDALDRLDVGMDVADLDADVLKVVGQVLRHLLGERRDEDALVHLDALANLVQEVVDLTARRTHVDLRIDEARRPDQLLDDDAAAALELVRAWRRRDEDHLPGRRLELAEAERAVVECRRQAEAELDERLLPRAVAAIHAADLRHRHVALVDDEEIVLREVADQRRRRLARPPAVEMARVVLDAVAEAHLVQHLEIVERALLEALHLEDLVLGAQLGEAQPQLLADRGDRLLQPR